MGGWMEAICDWMSQCECIEDGGDKFCEWGYLQPEKYNMYAPYNPLLPGLQVPGYRTSTPHEGCCACRGFKVPDYKFVMTGLVQGKPSDADPVPRVELTAAPRIWTGK